MSDIQIGDKVTAIYKTGKYIGEVTNMRPETILVKVLAVVTHPTQGDLHSHKDPDVPLFHERRALAYREQANIPAKMVKPYTEEIPDYKESLQNAIQKLRDQLASDGSLWAKKSLENMATLEREYF
jgi:kinase-associated protein B